MICRIVLRLRSFGSVSKTVHFHLWNSLNKHLIFSGKPLGKGTFGQVKQGTHILTGEKVKFIFLISHKVICKSKLCLNNRCVLGSRKNSRERDDKGQQRCWENHQGDQDPEESQTPQCDLALRGKPSSFLSTCICRLSRPKKSYLWSWSTVILASYLISSSVIKG